jgi:hypothetical protein
MPSAFKVTRPVELSASIQPSLPCSGCKFSSNPPVAAGCVRHATPLQPRLAGMKGKNLSHYFGANRRLLLFTQLAANPGEGFSQVSFHTLRVAERWIKDGFHLASTVIFIRPPRSRCEIHHYSTRFADPGCKTRSIYDQIAKVQRLTANASRTVSGNVKNGDIFRRHRYRVLLQTTCHRLCGGEILCPIKDTVACPLNRYFLP